MKRKISILVGILLAVLLAVPVWASGLEQEMGNFAQNVQQLTDKVNSLTAQSSEEDLANLKAEMEGMELDVSDTEEQGNLLTGSMIGTDVSGSTQIQLLFAKLQLQMSSQTKGKMDQYMGQLENLQKEQRQTAEMLAKADSLRAQKAKKPAEEICSFMRERKLAYPDTSREYDSSAWEYLIGSLTSYQESLSVQTQQLMVYMQDYMGQYNSYVQGVYSQIQGTNQSSSMISMGQTMFGEGGTGMFMTVLLIGVVCGVVLTVLVMKVRKRKTA